MPRKKSVNNRKVQTVNHYRDTIIVKARTGGQKQYIQDIKNCDIVFCSGPAGCGKTVIAVGMALQYILAEHPAFDKLVIMRPAKEACQESIGFLPGDLGEKMTPWAAPILDNIEVFIDQPQIKNLFYQKRVEIIPLSFGRGRSLNKSFVIVDEAQNCSREQMLMILTRIGERSKMVINGDITQSDIKMEGFSDAMSRLNGMNNVAICTMGKEDIVRNPLIAEIIERYQG